MDGLTACTGERVTMSLLKDTSPALIETVPEEDRDEEEQKRDTESRFLYLLIPIRQ